MNESIIDYPKSDALCPEIWHKTLSIDGMYVEWHLKPNVREKIQNIINNIYPKAKSIHIIGSITTNTYTKNADIDVHIIDPSKTYTEKQAENINKTIRQVYKTEYINEHPIELYFQANKYQDYMSDGCYDFISQKWLVGPEIKNDTYDPYSKYYLDIKKNIDTFIVELRNNILALYEKSCILYKLKSNSEIKPYIIKEFISLIYRGISLFDKIRKIRKIYSSPTSVEQALEFKHTKKWKVADATFKLLNKYGYTQIFKQIKDLMESFDGDNIDLVVELLPKSIINIIKSSLGDIEKLSEKDNMTKTINEGPISKVISASALAGLLAIPGVLPQKTLTNIISKISELYKNKPGIAKIEITKVCNSKTKDKMIGGYTLFQAVNIIARTLYAEGRGESEAGRKAIASVIYNRASGNVVNMPLVCLKKYQFSCWNKATATEKSPSGFNVKIPSSTINNETNNAIWENCKVIATKMLESEDFSPTTTATMYYAHAKVTPKWSTKLTDTTKIGNHTFGILKNHSPFL